MSWPWNDLPGVVESRPHGPDGRSWNLARIERATAEASTVDTPPILFIHGVLRNWRTFYPLVERLRADYDLYGLDQRGHGLSSHDLSAAYRVVDYAGDLPHILAALPARRVVLYGHSLGGMVALAAAALAPDRVAGLILEDPPFSTMGERLARLPLRRFFVGVRELLAEQRAAHRPAPTAATLFEPFSEMIVGETETGAPIRVRDQRDELSRWFSAKSFSRLDPAVLVPITDGRWMEGYDTAAILRGVRCPVALLQADEACGGMLIDADADRVLESLGSRCERVRFPGCGHQLHGTRPDEVVRAIRELVARTG
jgi:pimeloyl-ACP methyl ester carboxylesterase